MPFLVVLVFCLCFDLMLVLLVIIVITIIVINIVFPDVLHELIEWDEERLKCRLPLPASTSLDVLVNVFGLSDFMSRDQLARKPHFINFVYCFCLCCDNLMVPASSKSTVSRQQSVHSVRCFGADGASKLALCSVHVDLYTVMSNSLFNLLFIVVVFTLHLLNLQVVIFFL